MSNQKQPSPIVATLKNLAVFLVIFFALIHFNGLIQSAGGQ